MKLKLSANLFISAVLITVAAVIVSAQVTIKEQNVRAHMNFLASDAMQGRGSGTMFERLAGEYLASQMQQFGIEPAGDKDASGKMSYIQTVNIATNSFVEAPKITSSNLSFTHGKEMLVLRMTSEKISGRLQKMKVGGTPRDGAIVFVKAANAEEAAALGRSLGSLFGSGAAAVIIEETARWRSRWESAAASPVNFRTISGSENKPRSAIFILDKKSMAEMENLAGDSEIEISGKLGKPEIRKTWNAVGMIKGCDAKLSSEVILLSAHMDHVGVRENAPGEDKIFNGAD
ncbi:MAG: hypothetical protein HKN25_11670, partial [Pyrinomonadaceae bacterium]|nr:hypothetical protein [Pyrinomonadaceae bacterium]